MRIFATINWDKLRKKRIDNAWYDDIVSTMRASIDKQLLYSIDVPKQSGGWIHRYISPQNWMPLIYDSNSPSIHHSSLETVLQENHTMERGVCGDIGN